MKRIAALCLSLLLMIVACPALAGITPRYEKMVIPLGKSMMARCKISPSSLEKAGVRYASSDETIATVNNHGYVQSKALGECVIIITSKRDASITASIPVEVVMPVSSMAATLEKSYLRVGETARITCNYLPESATLKEATYVSSNEKIAVVDADGVVTALRRGTATVTARSVDGQARSSVRVTVEQPPEKVELSKAELTLVTGRRATFRATVLPQNTNRKQVIWSSSDPTIAAVAANGTVTALRPGDAVVTAVCEADETVAASATVHCVKLAESVSIEKKAYDVLIGETLQLAPRVLPEDTTNPALTYKVRDPRICYVDEKGLVTALKGGKTHVTISTTDGSKRSTTVTVRVVVPVTGVHFAKRSVRVGTNAHIYVNAVFEPEDATNRNASWMVENPRLVTLRGSGAKVRLTGLRWGRTTLHVTTEEGSFTDSIIVNVGSLSRAVEIEELYLHEGYPYIKLHNNSNMDIIRVTYELQGFDLYGEPVRMGKKSESYTAAFEGLLEPGKSTRTTRVRLGNSDAYDALECVKVAITGWETDTGYYDANDDLCYRYSVPSGSLDWHTYETADYMKSMEPDTVQEKSF